MTDDPALSSVAAGLTRVLDDRLDAFDAFAWLDFPNHHNVGDSAIWLGMRRYLRSRGDRVRLVSDAASYDPRVVEAALAASSEAAVLLHGGGNFGDLYRRHHVLRERVVADFPGLPVVQLPQSLHFADPEEQQRSAERFRVHADVTLLARDVPSAQAMGAFSDAVVLCPDTAHLLEVRLPPPTQRVRVLARLDREAAGAASVEGGVDWPPERPTSPQLLQRRVRARLGRRPGRVPQTVLGWTWAPVAERRLRRGLQVLGAGEVVVTDRLHAALLTLLGGRPVVIVDNSYGKLSRYFGQWLPDGHPLLHRASDLEQAMRSADALAG